MIKPVVTPRQAATEMRAASGGAASKTGVLFGPERTGLQNDDITLADTVLHGAAQSRPSPRSIWRRRCC